MLHTSKHKVPHTLCCTVCTVFCVDEHHMCTVYCVLCRVYGVHFAALGVRMQHIAHSVQCVVQLAVQCVCSVRAVFVQCDACSTQCVVQLAAIKMSV